ncbi:MAG: alpha/beta hydrolase-fold protein [bacterium]
MKRQLLITLLILLTGLIRAQENNISIGERISIKSEILVEERTLNISLPSDYSRSVTKYPVIYLLDAESQFIHTAGIIRFLAATNNMPPSILVSIVNTQRNRDLAPPSEIPGDQEHLTGSGGTEKFHAFLSKELIPYIEKNYRTEPFRILMGQSLGGLFVIHTLVNHPASFQGYIASSPSLMWNEEGETERARSVFPLKENITRFLYVSIGNEVDAKPNPISNFTDVLESKGSGSLKWKFEQFPGRSHETVPHIAFYDGLEFIYSDWKIDVKPLFTRSDSSQSGTFLNKLKEQYALLSGIYGYQCNPSESYLNMLGYSLMEMGQLGVAIDLFLYNVTLYPSSFNVYDSLAEAYLKNGRKDLAIKNYEKSLELNPGNMNATEQLKKLKGK